MLPIIALFAVVAPAVEGVTKEQGDVMVTTFDLPQGKVTVYLPDDMMAGDTIGGTVVATPSGTGSAAERNGAVLNGYVVELQGQGPRGSGGNPTWTLPAGINAVEIVLRSSDGRTQGNSSCWVRTAEYADSPAEFSCDPIVSGGSPVQVRGPFDGDLSNTSAMSGSTGLVPVAESPRSCVFAGVPGGTGPATIDVKEGGQNSVVHTRVVRVSLSASKTTLLRGERASLTLQVSGLEGLAESEFPVPIEVVNESPQVVRIEEATETNSVRGETLAFSIEKADLPPSGPVTFGFTLVGVQPGAFQVRALCFNVKMHDVKKAMNVNTFRAWIAAMIEVYKAKIAALKAEDAKDPSPGLKANIKRKEGILAVLESSKNPSAAGMDALKTAVDKALADDAFFAMAADLITTAASMLGYDSIPMPGIGAIIGGIKAIAGAAKLQKVLDAIAVAEKLMEEYAKLTDAQDKLDKVAEIKEALDKVKGALDEEE
jgi:hypothetical protein